MGRGQNSGGKRDKSAPDWLNPADAEPSGQAARAEEKPRRRRDEDEELDEPKGKKKGIKVGCAHTDKLHAVSNALLILILPLQLIVQCAYTPASVYSVMC